MPEGYGVSSFVFSELAYWWVGSVVRFNLMLLDRRPKAGFEGSEPSNRHLV